MDKKEFIAKLNSLPKEKQDKIRKMLAVEKRQQDLISKPGQTTNINEKQQNNPAGE